MARKPRRIPMFFKFLAGCLVLALLLIIGGAIVVHVETRAARRGDFLKKHHKRYLAYQEGLGRATGAVAGLLVNDPVLRQALSAPPGDPAAAPAIEIMTRAHGILSDKNSVQPDLMLLFDRTGSLVWASPGSVIEAADMGSLEAVNLVRAGSSYYDKILLHEGRAFQIAGTPVRGLARPGAAAAAAPGTNMGPGTSVPGTSVPGTNGEVVGGLILGVDVTRYMEQYKQQSDTNELLQYRLVLLSDNQVVASVMPREEWPELAEKLSDPQKWARIQYPGDGFVQSVVQLGSGSFNVVGGTDQNAGKDLKGELEGFAGLHSGKIGQLFLLRMRTGNEDSGARMLWTEIFIGITLATIVALILAKWITRPIKAFVEQSQKILEGETDLTQRINVCSRDETQDLADNINRVFERLYELAMEVQNAAFQVGASSAEISAASKQMLSGLKDQTLKIESSTAAVTELSASIQQVASNAAEATQMAEKSNISVTSAVERMEEIRAAVEIAADKMGDLGESSKRIGNIVEVIRQISEQTSLLALNASIEAAHAGEHGRGFAVVADEVSSLARRVGQSAKDIEALIQTIKEQTTEAVTSMQVGTHEVEGGTALVTTTLTDLKQLIEVVKDTAAAVQEQAMVSDEIARNMDAVQTIATEMLTGSEESVTQAEQLHELAFALEHSVGGFNLDSAAAPRPLADTSSTRARLPERTMPRSAQRGAFQNKSKPGVDDGRMSDRLDPDTRSPGTGK